MDEPPSNSPERRLLFIGSLAVLVLSATPLLPWLDLGYASFNGIGAGGLFLLAGSLVMLLPIVGSVIGRVRAETATIAGLFWSIVVICWMIGLIYKANHDEFRVYLDASLGEMPDGLSGWPGIGLYVGLLAAFVGGAIFSILSTRVNVDAVLWHLLAIWAGFNLGVLCPASVIADHRFALQFLLN